jgi:hypothetical protein
MRTSAPPSPKSEAAVSSRSGNAPLDTAVAWLAVVYFTAAGTEAYLFYLLQ